MGNSHNFFFLGGKTFHNISQVLFPFFLLNSFPFSVLGGYIFIGYVCCMNAHVMYTIPIQFNETAKKKTFSCVLKYYPLILSPPPLLLNNYFIIVLVLIRLVFVCAKLKTAEKMDASEALLLYNTKKNPCW